MQTVRFISRSTIRALPWTLFLVVGIALFLPAGPAAARRRRKRQPTGRITGQLDAQFLKQAPIKRLSRAYWEFGVPNLQLRRPPISYDEFLVFLDVWDDDVAATGETREIKFEGAAFAPRLLALPRRSEDETIQLHNYDVDTHRVTSKDTRALKGIVLQQNMKSLVKIENILPLEKGRYVRYEVRSVDLPSMRGEILFVKSTVFGRADAQGRFNLTRVPRGEHTLRVYYQGKILLKKSIKVGRRRLKLKRLVLTKGP